MILIIDNQMSSGAVLAQMLKTCGHGSVAVATAGAALTLLAKVTPDVVVLDAWVPDDVAEPDVLRRIRADPTLRSLPIIVYSADADPKAVDRAMRLGAQDYVVKGQTGLDEVCLTVGRYVGA